MQSGGKLGTLEKTLEQLQQAHDVHIERLGEETPLSIQKGLDFAFGLQQALHALESEHGLRDCLKS
jgi:hypothetical protein